MNCRLYNPEITFGGIIKYNRHFKGAKGLKGVKGVENTMGSGTTGVGYVNQKRKIHIIEMLQAQLATTTTESVITIIIHDRIRPLTHSGTSRHVKGLRRCRLEPHHFDSF